MSKLEDSRREYTRGGLQESELPARPMALFDRWMQQAIEAEICDPTAMVVATVDANGQPFMRTVLLKHADERGFVFYTNLGSRKAQHISTNPQVCLHMPWHPLDRQIHITGKAEKLGPTEVLRYFASRPRDSQIGAWASHQSSRVDARSVLENKFFELKQKFAKGDIPVPSFWGGYRIVPQSMGVLARRRSPPA